MLYSVCGAIRGARNPFDAVKVFAHANVDENSIVLVRQALKLNLVLIVHLGSL